MFNWLKNTFSQAWEGVERSSRWAVVRQHHLVENPQCEACGSHQQLEVHHITPVHVDPSKELDFDNLVTLCTRDHLTFGHLGCWQCYNPDVLADAKAYREKLQKFRGPHHGDN